MTPFDLKNKISPVRPNVNIKKLAQMGVPFQSRNKVIACDSFSKSVISSSHPAVPFSPFSTSQVELDKQSFTALPNSPANATAADSNYHSRLNAIANRAQANKQRGQTQQSRSNVTAALAKQKKSVPNPIVSTSPVLKPANQTQTSFFDAKTATTKKKLNVIAAPDGRRQNRLHQSQTTNITSFETKR